MFKTDHTKAAVATFIALLAVYSATGAPDVTFWDSGEFLAAIHSLGIPHPPGTPLYVITANVWAHLFAPLAGFARAVNLFSGVCAAAGCAILASLFSRWMRDPFAGVTAAICAGATSSLWMSATETEVYSASFLVATLLLWIANQVRETGNFRYAVLLAYVAGLGWALHLTALISLPAAIVLAAHNRPNTRKWSVLIPQILAAAFLGASVVAFMYVRARHDPAINQGNPSTIGALLDVIVRRQYDVAGLWPRQAPVYLQLGNLFEWADWQFALGLNSTQPPTFPRTTVTIIFALLGIAGCVEHWRVDRPSWRTMMVLFVGASLGVAVYLNLKAGPSYGIGYLAEGAKHEARERDYFFILAWVSWGVWAGIGALWTARKILSARSATPVGLAIAAAPMVLNWTAVDRSRPPKSNEAGGLASRILSSAPHRALVLARGDNDTYPVWYLKEVMKRRPDVVSVTVPMLAARWYRDELARRYGLLDSGTVETWRGTEATLRVVRDRAVQQSRPVRGPYHKVNR